MEEKCFLPKITVYLWIFRTVLIFLAIAFFLFLLKLYYAAWFSLGLAVITVIYLLLFFKKYEISLLKDFLVIRYGVIFSVTRILPLNKIIYVKVLKTPVLKAFALDIIIIKTIKGVLILPELKCEESEKIKRKIEEKNL